MSNRRKISALVKLDQHGGVRSAHRFGTDGDWSQPGAADSIVYMAELVSTGPEPAYFNCDDCASTTTGLRDPRAGEFSAVGITHSPRCPWLTAAARTWTRQP
jgi:hypothetical protein